MSEEVTILVKRSENRKKSIGLEITKEGAVVVRAPKWASNADINRVLSEKKEWIETSIRKVRFQNEIRKNRPPVGQRGNIQRRGSDAPSGQHQVFQSATGRERSPDHRC